MQEKEAKITELEKITGEILVLEEKLASKTEKIDILMDKIKSLEKDQSHEEDSVASLRSSLMLNEIWAEELEKVKLCLQEKNVRITELEKQEDEFIARETALNETLREAKRDADAEFSSLEKQLKSVRDEIDGLKSFKFPCVLQTTELTTLAVREGMTGEL